MVDSTAGWTSASQRLDFDFSLDLESRASVISSDAGRSPIQIGGCATVWSTRPRNRAALVDFPGQSIHSIHACHPRRIVVRDKDSTAGPTYRSRKPAPATLFWLHSLPSAVRVQPIRSSGAVRTATGQHPQRQWLVRGVGIG
jgi:hypothetical protein